MKCFTLILASLLVVALTVSWVEAVPLPKGTTENESDEVASSVSKEKREGEHEERDVEKKDEGSNNEDNSNEEGGGEGEEAAQGGDEDEEEEKEEGEGDVEEGDEGSNNEDNNDEGGAEEGEAAEEEGDDEEDEGEGGNVEGDNNDDNNDDEGTGDGEEKEEEEDGAGEEHVRKKRQFKATATVHDNPWGKDYSVSGGFHKTFNKGRTSVGFEGYSNWGASGRDKGGLFKLSHSFPG